MGTIIDDRTKKLMLIKKQKELDALFAEQEAYRQKTQLRKVKAAYGDLVDGPTTPLDEPQYGQQPWDMITNPQQGMPSQNFNTTDPTQTPENAFNFRDYMQTYGQKFLKNGLPKALGAGMQLAPVIGNLIGGATGKAEQINARDYYNPRRNDIMSLMRNRRMDVSPQMDAIQRGESSAMYNLRGTAGSRGEFMGNATSIYNKGMQNRSGVLASKQNADLGYQGQEAEMLASLGSQESQAKWNTMDWNQQSLANKRNMWRAGLSQLSQYGQIKELGKNQKTADQERLAALEDMLGPVAGFMKSLNSVQSLLNNK